MIDSMESEICMKMLSNFNETKFCVSRSVYSMVKIIHLNDAFSQFFELKASPVQSQSLQQKDKKRRKGKCKKIKKTKSLKMSVTFLSKTLKVSNFDLCTCPRKNVGKYVTLVKRMACRHVASVCLSWLETAELIWPISSL